MSAAPNVKLSSPETTGPRCFGKLGVCLDQRALERDQSSVSSAGDAEKEEGSGEEGVRRHDGI